VGDTQSQLSDEDTGHSDVANVKVTDNNSNSNCPFSHSSQQKQALCFSECIQWSHLPCPLQNGWTVQDVDDDDASLEHSLQPSADATTSSPSSSPSISTRHVPSRVVPLSDDHGASMSMPKGLTVTDLQRQVKKLHLEQAQVCYFCFQTEHIQVLIDFIVTVLPQTNKQTNKKNIAQERTRPSDQIRENSKG
jgi:hypothetical protein